MKRTHVLLSLLLVLTFSINAHGALEVIGTANYQGQDYQLIHMEDGPFGPITWLDYSNGAGDWENQVAWANGLGADLTVTLYDGYSTGLDWNTGWRLPETVDGERVWGYDGTTTAGYNITSSEMGFLFYYVLGNKGYYNASGGPQAGHGLVNTGEFNNLQSAYYWSGTEYSANTGGAWDFYLYGGGQDCWDKTHGANYGLAVLPGDVSAVPLPGALLLLGSGLAGLGVIRNKKGKR